jgi:hypothetical protein
MAVPTADGDVPASDIETDRAPHRHRDDGAPGAEASEPSGCAGASGGGFNSGLPPEWAHSAPWRQEVQRRRITLLDELARLELHGTAQQTRAYLIDDLLADADAASREKVTAWKWWWGTEVDRAWARLREVEERTVHLLPDPELPVCLADAVRHAHAYLDADDPRVQHMLAVSAHQDPPRSTDELRASIVSVLRAAHERADQANKEARYLRNRLLLASAFSALFAAAIVSTQAVLEHTSFVDGAERWAGGRWSYLVVIMVFGGVGALFTAIPAISKIPSNHGPFNLPLQQGLLKIAFGPLVAVVGIALLNTGVSSQFVPESVPKVLLMAALFGAGQHAVTRYVDQRAEQILTTGTTTTGKADHVAKPGTAKTI